MNEQEWQEMKNEYCKEAKQSKVLTLWSYVDSEVSGKNIVAPVFRIRCRFLRYFLIVTKLFSKAWLIPNLMVALDGL